jgi:hypothetical protein
LFLGNNHIPEIRSARQGDTSTLPVSSTSDGASGSASSVDVDEEDNSDFEPGASVWCNLGKTTDKVIATDDYTPKVRERVEERENQLPLYEFPP